MTRVWPLVALLGCVLSRLSAQQAQDSAGIRIVTYDRGSAPLERWTLETRPVLEIGRDAAEGPQSFVDIMGVVRLRDGNIAVANGRPSEIRIFAPDGRVLRSLGRNGPGPGEFDRVLFRLLRSGDTLIGMDNSGRAHVFDPRGQLVRSLPRPRPPVAQSVPMRMAFDRAGDALVQVVEPSAPEASKYVIIWRESADTTRYERVLRFLAYHAIPRRGPAPPFEVFGASSRVATNGERICTGFNNRFAIECYDANGRPRLFVRKASDGREITEDDRQFFREAYLAANKGARPEAIRAIEESNRLTQFASRAPVFSRLLFATTGQLWVSEFDRSDNMLGPPSFRRPQRPLRWSVFDSDGRWRADLETPARFEVFEAGPDYVIGATLGEDDVEHVTMYRIRK